MKSDRESLDVSLADDGLGRIVEAAVEGLQAGESLDIEALVAANPVYEAKLRELLPAIEMLVQVGGASGPQKRSTDHVVGPSLAHEQLGDFRIVREIGRGGMGIVYEAEQISLRRRVALKVLPLASMLAPEPLARFQIESQAAGALRHPHIIPVFAVGCDRGMHFYAMQYVEGRTLAEIIEELRSQTHQHQTHHEDSTASTLSSSSSNASRSPLSQSAELAPSDYAKASFFRAVARLGSEVAEALDHAHGLGVIHRDIKPSNLLIDSQGAVFVTDFGLAHMAGSEALTRTGEIIGTLRYMSPEQATGSDNCADCRSDVYSLGATLYELVTLRPPCASDDRHALVRQILADEPLSPRRLQPHVPRDLETIILKALQKDPLDRYASARQLADDLQLFQGNRPILARRRSTIDRVRKWTLRNPSFVGAIVAAITIALGVLLVSNQMVRRSWTTELAARSEAESARAKSEEQRRLAEDRFALAQRSNFNLQLAQVRAIMPHDPQRAKQLLDGIDLCPPKLRDFTWRLYRRHCDRDQVTFIGHDGPVKDAVNIPKHRLVVSGGVDGTIRLWDSASGALIERIDAHEDVVSSVDVSPDQSLVATASHDGRVRVWKIETAPKPTSLVEVVAFPGGSGPVIDVHFSSDGQTLAFSVGHTVRIMDVALGVERAVLVGSEATQHSQTGQLAFARSGKYLAAACSDQKQVWIWKFSSQRLVATIPSASRRSCVAFGADDATLAIGDEKDIVLWNWKTKRRLATLPGHEGEMISGMSFSSRGETLISTGYDGCIRTWDLRNANAQSSFTGHEDRIASMDFSSSERIVTTASYDGTAKLWKIDDTLEERTIQAHEGAVTSIARSSREPLLASAGSDGSVKLWNVPTGELVGAIASNGVEVSAVALSPDGNLIATAGMNKSVRLWDRHDLRELAVLNGHDDFVGVLEFSPDGAMLASASRDRTIRLWNLKTRQSKARLIGHSDKIWALAFSRDSRTLVSTGRDGTIRFWNTRTGTTAKVLNEPDGNAIGCCVLSPDGETLATATSRLSDRGPHYGIIHLWDTATFELRNVLQGHTDEVLSIAFSPDGHTLASSSRDRMIRLWDPQTGQERACLQGHPTWIYGVVFTLDGNYLASAGAEGEIMLWNGTPTSAHSRARATIADRADDESIRTLERDTAGVRVLDLCAQHDLLATGNSEGDVRVYELDSDTHRLQWLAHSGKINAVEFSPDGVQLLTAGADEAVRLWNARTGALLAELAIDASGCSAKFSPDGKLCIVGTMQPGEMPQGTLAAYDVATRAKAWQSAGPIHGVFEYTPDRSAIVVAEFLPGESTTVTWRSAEAGDQIKRLPNYMGIVQACSVSPNGKLLALSGSDPDRPVEIWDCASLSRIRILRGHKDEVYALAISPDGQLLASGSLDHTIRVCELESGKLLKVFRGHIDGVTNLQFSSDGKTLVSASRDHTVKVWKLANIRRDVRPM